MSNSSSGLGSFFENFDKIGSKMNEMSEEARSTLTQAAAGGGLVEVEVNGWGELTNCKIDPSLFAQGDAELLEDLFITAANEALSESKEKQMELMKNAAQTMNLPTISSLKDMFEK